MIDKATPMEPPSLLAAAASESGGRMKWHVAAALAAVLPAAGGGFAAHTLSVFFEEMAVKEDRVVLRCRPYATFAQPPRHLYRNDQEERITHWLSSTVAWDATDPA